MAAGPHSENGGGERVQKGEEGMLYLLREGSLVQGEVKLSNSASDRAQISSSLLLVSSVNSSLVRITRLMLVLLSLSRSFMMGDIGLVQDVDKYSKLMFKGLILNLTGMLWAFLAIDR